MNSKTMLQTRRSLLPLKRHTGRVGATRPNQISAAGSLFFLIVVLPTAISAVYLFGFCADRYISEAQFIVRSVSQKRIAGLDSILKTFGLDSAQDDSYAIAAYLQSKDALHELEEAVPVRDIFSRPEADKLSSLRNPWTDSTFEALYNYSHWRISIVRDAGSGVTTLRVSAFRPEDAQLLADKLLGIGEKLANSMNYRAQQDSLRVADAEVASAEGRFEQVSRNLSAFRNSQMLVDPTENSMKVIELIGNLSAQLSLNMAETNETSTLSPDSPSLNALRTRSAALQDQITAERSKLAGSDGGLASKISDYEGLVFSQKMAEKEFASALSSLETARQDARRQQVYIETFVRPDRPDEAEEPRRVRMLSTIGFVCMIVFSLSWVVYAGAKEHSHG